MAGARPRWLSLSLIIEEGLPADVLRRVLQSVAESVGVAVVAGDTKVVPRGVADQLFLNTSGIGELLETVPVGPAALKVGDELLVTGNVGQHGVAILACFRLLEDRALAQWEMSSSGGAVIADVSFVFVRARRNVASHVCEPVWASSGSGRLWNVRGVCEDRVNPLSM